MKMYESQNRDNGYILLRSFGVTAMLCAINTKLWNQSVCGLVHPIRERVSLDIVTFTYDCRFRYTAYNDGKIPQPRHYSTVAFPATTATRDATATITFATCTIA
jgi:hypothetical protein